VWDAPWGRGRPGWHIECSAMAIKYLGESFDIHCGGVDNIFPHHEDEIAQSECCTGSTFAHTWLHCEHLIVDGRKMSKSAGNFYTVRDLLPMGFSGREIRMELLAARYRQSLNFTLDGLRERKAALERLDDFQEKASALAASIPEAESEWATAALEAFGAALDDDLNTSAALVALFDLVSEGFRRIQHNRLAPEDARAALQVLQRMDSVLAILTPDTQGPDPDILALVDDRQQARAAKIWAESDRIRDELARRGWAVKDTPDGPKLRPL